MSADNYAVKSEIGNKILAAGRSNLYFAMRFMDTALCAFEYRANEGNHYAGTDGNVIYFAPDYLMDIYEQEVSLVNRLYLHMTLHCVYRHLFRCGGRSKRLWNLACDIAVEAVIDGLEYSCVKMRLPAVRDACYRRLRSDCKILTCDLIYDYLNKNTPEERELAELENEFLADDHEYWYHSGDKKSRSQSERKWENISSKMQTSMETVEKGAGTESQSLYQSIEAENRGRYDYREFLRRFAVYREEILLDPDDFDYTIYTYGLSHYGNMPLIEPLEQREIKKIQDFVIAIDTSFSCTEEQVKGFLEETCRILFTSESFFQKVNIRVLQCDNRIQSDDRLANAAEMEDYINHLAVKGRGGTDFRPVF
ncbi:MAG: VWA-like domain-containing protein, partial [Butyrivibrio sp.]|nr:VWA-like domain-containing protein [Butyrivibrio sp.]